MPRGAKITAICNQKGGTAKTSTAVNLGIGLARAGKRVGNVLKKLKGSDEERKKGERKGRKGNGNEDIDNKMSALRE